MSSGVGGFEGSGGVQIRRSGGRKSPSGVQGQSPGGGLGAKPPEADDKQENDTISFLC